MKRLIWVVVVLIAFSGCGGGSGGGSASAEGVTIGCATVTNDGDSAVCATKTASGVTIIDAGVVTRSTHITATVSVENSEPTDFNGFWEMTFSAGCNGASTWPILPIQPFTTVPAGQTAMQSVGGNCGDMSPLGENTLTATLYDADATTVLDQVVVNFTLVE